MFLGWYGPCPIRIVGGVRGWCGYFVEGGGKVGEEGGFAVVVGDGWLS